MYVPAFSAIDEATSRAVVDEIGAGWLVTSDADGSPQATLMPVLWRGDVLIAHMARANPHWRSIANGTPGLMIVTGPQAYVSPSWYASKAEHGRVVPTWNYLAVHLSGPVTVHDDPQWVLAVVSALTDQHERARPEPWHVTDAPDDYIATQLKAIVGIQLRVERVDGKAKLSQNRSEADRAGVADGLGRLADPGSAAIASAMRDANRDA